MEEVSELVVGQDEVLIHVKACGIAYHDFVQRNDQNRV